jgi:RNA polymerase sigma-70 factor (ECF subfamily)
MQAEAVRRPVSGRPTKGHAQDTLHPVAEATSSRSIGACNGTLPRADPTGLWSAIAPEVHLFVARRVSNPEDAEDITQQALAVACARVDRLRGANALSWVLAIARNLVIDHYRAQNRFLFVEFTDALAQIEPALQIAPLPAIAADECRDELTGVFRGIAGICLAHQVAILLADVYGHCDKRSAATLRMSVPCFKLLLHRARAGFRETAVGRQTERHYLPPARHLGVTCYLSGDELVDLRNELLAGLKLQ